MWGWRDPRGGTRESPVRIGEELAFGVAPEARRLCGGVSRADTWTPCPYGAELPPDARRDQCQECAALDRSSSVAADTLNDPRPYAVYLAYFGPGLHKVGITAAERGTTRLLEQAAVCFTFLGEGPLMTARRTEAVLGAALRIPDRMPGPAKRAARLALPPGDARASELRALHDDVTALQERLPESLRPRPFHAVDHAVLFGLDPAPPRPAAEVTALLPGSTLTGTIRVIAGHDVYLEHLETPDAHLLLDTRLTAGWPLSRTDSASTADRADRPGTGAHPPTTPVPRPAADPQPLF